MKNCIATLALLSFLAFCAGGCMGRLIGEGAEAGLGPKGKYWQENSLPAKESKPLAPYTNIELGKVANAYGRNVPEEFFSQFPREFQKRFQTEGPGKTLVVNVAILHYEKADVTDNIFGPLEEVVAHVELVDKTTGSVLATGNAVGRTGKTVGLGVQNKAEGLAKGISSWVNSHRGKEEKDKDKKQ